MNNVRRYIARRGRKTLSTMAGRPLPALMFFLGAALGLVLRIPLLPSLDESAAQIIGATIGASIAVFGAFWLAGDNERRAAVDMEKRLGRAVGMVFRRGRQCMDAADALERNEPGARARLDQAVSDLADDANSAHDGMVPGAAVDVDSPRLQRLNARIAEACDAFCDFQRYASFQSDAPLARAHLRAKLEELERLVDSVSPS